MLLLALSLAAAAAAAAAAPHQTTILYLPLDERFATRGMFLNLAAAVDSAAVLTPPTSALPRQREPADPERLFEWLEAQPAADAAILSTEMLLYGGLIESRIGNASTETLLARQQRLLDFVAARPAMDVRLSGVVMRIPSYNTVPCVEDQWYWEFYGADIYDWSYYNDRFAHTGAAADRARAAAAGARVPEDVLGDYAWRRQRNHNVSMDMLAALPALPNVNASITLDDSAQYGLNVEEAAAINATAAALGLLGDRVLVYPGADEVALTMLAAVMLRDRPVPVRVVWREPNATALVPAYEGLPVRESVAAQLRAASCSPGAEAGAALAVNNFAAEPQLEASQQTPTPAAAYAPLLLAAAAAARGGPVAVADVRFANGGDLSLVAALPALPAAYAGWNTNGNSLGTAAANLALAAGGLLSAEVNVQVGPWVGGGGGGTPHTAHDSTQPVPTAAAPRGRALPERHAAGAGRVRGRRAGLLRARRPVLRRVLVAAAAGEAGGGRVALRCCVCPAVVRLLPVEQDVRDWVRAAVVGLGSGLPARRLLVAAAAGEAGGGRVALRRCVCPAVVRLLPMEQDIRDRVRAAVVGLGSGGIDEPGRPAHAHPAHPLA